MNFFSSYWVVKYREDKKGKWISCPGLKGGWVADPFIYTFNGCTVIFAEIMEYRTGKGYIGCSVWNGNRFGKWFPIIREDWHLSYPLVFEYHNKVYMIPEQYQSNEIALYECEIFPNKWKRMVPLLEGGEYVDSTILFQDGDTWLFSLKLSEKDKKRESLVRMHLKNLEEIDKYEVLFESGAEFRRPAGNFIVDGVRILRPAQDCEKIYGGGLLLYAVEECTRESYVEKEVKRYYVDNLNLGKDKKKYIGIHTYNRDVVSNIEVIDLKQKRIVPIELFFKALRRIGK